MRIEPEIKLDYKDVLLRPKRSELTSRKEVDLMRTFTFKNAGADGAGNPDYGWTGIPIVAANMDTTGTFETAKVLAQHHMLTCISKHNDVNRWAHKLDGYGVYKTQEIGNMTENQRIGKIESTIICVPLLVSSTIRVNMMI